jgi:transcriptional regulator with XRE-family HTH domain
MPRYRDKKLLQSAAIVLKELRDKAGVNQLDVYHEIGIHVGRIESAKANFSISTLSALCKYFNLPLSEFCRRVEHLEERSSRKN